MHDDRRRAESFGDDAEQYDRARPGYPDALIDDLVHSVRRPSVDVRSVDVPSVDVPDSAAATAVLDVGCGTGKVGRMFAARGCTVLGVEPDPRMAAVAQRHGLEVELATFEEWQAGDRTFDLVVAGQTWHWIEPDAGARKAAQALRPNGRVAAFWNRGSLPSELKEALLVVYGRIVPGLATHSILLGNVADTRFVETADSFRRAAAFDDPQIATYTWLRRYTTAEWLDILATHSDHRTLPADRLAMLSAAVEQVLVDFGGAADVTYDTVVVTARAAH